MPNPILPGQIVQWTTEDTTFTGRIIQLLGNTVNKSADGTDPDQGARVKLIQEGVFSNDIQVLRTGDLTPFLETTERLVKAANPAQLDALISGLTTQERDLLATAWFAQTGPKLPTKIIGEEGDRTPMDGIDQGTGGTGHRA
jgi:hypothetical protein